jgi:hypothetical protein
VFTFAHGRAQITTGRAWLPSGAPGRARKRDYRGDPMNDDTENPENPGQRNEFRVLDFQDRCPDCDVAVGEAHVNDEADGGCDVARCLVTGPQRLTCEADHAADHDCGRDVWTGGWPGLLFPVKSAC